MKTGFYNTSKLTKKDTSNIMKEAIMLSYKVIIESKYVDSSYRNIESTVTISEALKLCNDIKIVDRSIQHGNILGDYGEISITNTNWKHNRVSSFDTEGWLFLYCYLSIPNLQKLTEKYSLKME